MRNNQLARQLRNIDLRKPCLKCKDPINSRGQSVPHGYLHPNCEQEASRDLTPLLERHARLKDPAYVHASELEIARVTERLTVGLFVNEGVPREALVQVKFEVDHG